MLNAAALFGPCHGIIQHALSAYQWLYVRDICSITCLPRNTVECALVQLMETDLVIRDSTLNRYSLARLSPKYIQKRLGPVHTKKCAAYILA